MRIVVGILFGALAASSDSAAQNCPAGTYRITDNMGTYHCEPNGAKPAAVTRAMNGGCPAGSRPWQDAWGNASCRSNESLSGIGRPSSIQAWPPAGAPRVPGPPDVRRGLD